MVSKHKASPEQFRHLAQLIQAATQTADWQALKRYDLQLRELLVSHRPILKDPKLAPVIQRAKQAHAIAAQALEKATAELQQQMELVSAQQERAMAYQLAMTMETEE
ncbi:LafD [Vibrio sp. CAU 1672]|uniref:LafD n=1 Tax=Vibrio sp. CAU 1672 TaxID=3032594 RepID=UPI0023DC5D04|nr:LafD [Vibrio sp. CAU 1672]MDF2152608.1 LafD [Vibrio sp. CAU 1672]